MFLRGILNMAPLMLEQVGSAGEPLPTAGAPEGLGPKVGPLMDEDFQGGAEAAPTFTALVGPLA